MAEYISHKGVLYSAYWLSPIDLRNGLTIVETKNRIPVQHHGKCILTTITDVTECTQYNKVHVNKKDCYDVRVPVLILGEEMGESHDM